MTKRWRLTLIVFFFIWTLLHVAGVWMWVKFDDAGLTAALASIDTVVIWAGAVYVLTRPYPPRAPESIKDQVN